MLSYVKVKMAIDLLRAQQLSLLPLDDWVAAERKRKAKEEAETRELEAAAQVQVGRPRQRWCIGSGKCSFCTVLYSAKLLRLRFTGGAVANVMIRGRAKPSALGK